MTAVANTEFNARKYGRLLARTLPSVIETEEENERMLMEMDRLMSKGEDNLTPEEDKLLALMVRLVEEFEAKAYPIDEVPPHRILKHLMEANNLRQSDLLPIFGSRGYISDIVNGKRGISKNHAKALAAFFHVPADLFL